MQSAREYHLQREREKRQQREALRQQRLAEVRTVIRRLAPAYPAIRAVCVFGSLAQPGRFAGHSDIDVAVECDDVETESQVWQALEEALQQNVDVRPLEDPITLAVEAYGELVYDREVHSART